jgi:hypothetical protein
MLALVLVVLLGLAVLPLFGTLLTTEDPLQTADVVLVLEGTGPDALDVAEQWRERGLANAIVLVEAPVETHALVAYWSDFVRWGLAQPPSTPPSLLHVVRAASTRGTDQAEAALPVLDELGAHVAIAPGGGAIGTRLMARDMAAVLAPQGITVHMIAKTGAHADRGMWWTDADSRRAVLDSWLRWLVPALDA